MKSVLTTLIVLGLGLASPAYAQQQPMQNVYGGAQPLVAPPAVPPPAATPPAATPPAETPPAGTTPTKPLVPPSETPEQEVKGDGTGVVVVPRKNAPPAAPDAAPVGKAKLKSSSPSLPFTGFDVLALLVGGGFLIAVGIGMRRLSRDPL